MTTVEGEHKLSYRYSETICNLH